MRLVLAGLLLLPAVALAQGWGNVSQPQEEVFTWAKWWTEPIGGGFWMAWTRATVAVFVFVFSAIGLMALLE
ncbi:MAG: hypothetical protein AAF913_08755, partial [Pseudomonadota bacterium]